MVTKQNDVVATIGDPASIGPEVCLKALSDYLPASKSSQKLHLFGSQLTLKENFNKQYSHCISDKRIILHDLNPTQVFKAGQPTQLSAARALLDLESAAQYCLDNRLKALVTGPVDKFRCAEIQKDFRGQTEFLKEISKAENVTMMLASPLLKVSLVTTHIPLSEVPKAITSKKIEICIQNTLRFLKNKKSDIKIAVCGLNPHAGENGLLGYEEREFIEACIKKLNSELDADILGPFPADTLFHFAKKYDAIVGMYHDQALIPVKTLAFDQAINMSLGLPFLRCSVDHGTAFSLAGKNKASFLSYKNALKEAFKWAEN